jgi:Domain of unknown function (DUF1931)
MVRRGGRVAYPNGVEPEPRPREGLKIISYDAVPGVREFERLCRPVEAAELEVAIAACYPLAEAAAAHERLARGACPRKGRASGARGGLTMALMGIDKFERFFRVAAGLDVDKSDLKRYSDFVNGKIYDLLLRGQRRRKRMAASSSSLSIRLSQRGCRKASTSSEISTSR